MVIIVSTGELKAKTAESIAVFVESTTTVYTIEGHVPDSDYVQANVATVSLVPELK